MNVSLHGAGEQWKWGNESTGPGVGGSGFKNSDGKGQKFLIKFKCFVKPEAKLEAWVHFLAEPEGNVINSFI